MTLKNQNIKFLGFPFFKLVPADEYIFQANQFIINIMNHKNSKEEIQKRAETIKAIYQKYLTKLDELKKEQNKIVNKFIKELEQKKIEEIKKTLK